MTIQEPAWLKRTRPCPFFSQGRCLFADSCNFLHDVKVRNAIAQASLTAVKVEQPPLLPKPVFDPPSVVVDAPSPRSDDLASPESSASSAYDSSRYSGLLSVLSDVIGPPPDPFTAFIPVSPLISAASSLPLPSDSVVTGSWATSPVPDTNADPEAALVDSSVSQTEAFLPAEDGEPAAEPVVFVPDDAEATDGNTTPCFVEDTETHVIGSEVEESNNNEATDNHREQDLAAKTANRQSSLSSFTGASLLASPRDSVFAEPSASSPIEDGAGELLSPVELSAKLRPFPIPLSASTLKRGDSIDSGYADGDSWVSPLRFPCSPPRNFRSSVMLISHSRQTSHTSLALRDRRVSYDIRAVRPSLYNLIDVKEIDSGGNLEHGLEGNEDTAHSIFGAYHTSLSEEQGESEACDSSQVNVTATTVKTVKKDDKQRVPAGRRSLHQSSSEHLYPTMEYDLDLCNQTSFVSDDNLSFRTALSARPSYDNLCDISKISPVKQDSLLSFVSSCSSPNTSVLSHYSDANESLEQPVAGTRLPESCSATATDLASQDDSTGASQTKASEECSFPEEVTLDSNIPFVPASHRHRRSPTSNPPSNHSRNLPPAVDSLSHVSFGVDVACILADVNDLQEFSPETVSALRERSPSILPYTRDTPNLSPSTGNSCSPSPCENTLGYALGGIGDLQKCIPEKFVVSPQEQSPEVLRPDEPCSKPKFSAESSRSPSSVKVVHDSAAHCGDEEHGRYLQIIGLLENMSGTFHFDEDDPRTALSGASEAQKVGPQQPCNEPFPDQPRLHSDDDGPGGPVPLPAASYSRPQNPEIGVSLGSGGVTKSFDSEGSTLTQRLLFPLPSPFLPAESVKHSTLPGGVDTSTLCEETAMNLTKDVQNACRVSHREVHHSGSDLTEKARPRQLPVVESPNPDTDSAVLRRNRAQPDLTLKGNSSLSTVPEDIPHISSASDDSLEFSSLPHSTTIAPDVSSSWEGQPLYCAPHTSQQEVSNGKPSTSGTDLLQSETVFRPLLTGRRSLLCSSLAELVPRVNLTVTERSSPTHSSNRLQAREVGSTVVPLGFRRYKPQSVTTSSRSVSQSFQLLPALELREMLRIRTDVARGDITPECSSASHVSFRTRSPLPAQSMSAPPTAGLRQLHLTSIVNKRSSTLSTQSSSITSSIVSIDHVLSTPSPQSPSVSSTTSLSHSSSLRSYSCKQIPEHINHTLKRCSSDSLIPRVTDNARFPLHPLTTRRDSQSLYAPIQQTASWRLSHYRAGSRNHTSVDEFRRFSSRALTLDRSCAVDEEQEIDDSSPISHPVVSSHVDSWTGAASVHTTPVHAIATPKPSLMFAIASDDVDHVRRVLENGEAGPNDSVGPQSALAFTLTNHKLAHKQEIVKALLAYGANPSALQNSTLNPAPRMQRSDEPSGPPPETTLEGMDPATRYFVARADAAHTRQTSQLIYRSFFRPLTRVRYDVIGQDWALEQFFRILSMHSQKLAVAPIVVLLCGPSGHGKSLLARKFGSLLDVPTHTVNMTTLRSTHDIWQSYSMSPYEEPSSYTLAEFLIENEGKRCVVVLDEIEKVEDQKALWSLLMPWELGRCSLEAGKRHVDARNVIWLGTSNIGHELVFEHHENRAESDKRMSREDYLELMGVLRPCVSHCLGASLVSRITTVLPFVPFTLDEKKAIAAEAVYVLAGDAFKTLSPQDVESLVMKALPSYQPSEGARSLHRAISNILIDKL